MSDTLVINEIYLSLQGESTFAGLPCIFVRLTACNLRCSYCDTAYAFTEGEKKSLADIRGEIRRLAAPFIGTRNAECGMRNTESEPIHEPDALSTLSPREERAGREPERGAIQPRTSSARPSPPSARGEGEESLVHGTDAPTFRWRRFPHVGGYNLPLIELTGGEPLLQPNSIPLMELLCDDGFTVLLETSGAHDISKIDPRVRRIMDLKCPSSDEVERNRWENLRHLTATDEIKFVIGTQEDYNWAKEKIAGHRLASICPLLFSWVHPLAPEQQDKSLKKVPPGQTPVSRRELAEKIIADALPVRFQIQLHKVIWPPEQRGV